MSVEEVQQAVLQEEEREKCLRQGVTYVQPTAGTNNAHHFLRAVKTSCRTMGQTPEAAEYARRKCFALQDFFGMHAWFLSISPNNECTFRVCLYANAGEVVS